MLLPAQWAKTCHPLAHQGSMERSPAELLDSTKGIHLVWMRPKTEDQEPKEDQKWMVLVMTKGSTNLTWLDKGTLRGKWAIICLFIMKRALKGIFIFSSILLLISSTSCTTNLCWTEEKLLAEESEEYITSSANFMVPTWTIWFHPLPLTSLQNTP